MSIEVWTFYKYELVLIQMSVVTHILIYVAKIKQIFVIM